MFITTSLFSQSSIDSILMIKINLYRKSLNLVELVNDTLLIKSANIMSSEERKFKMVGHTHSDIKLKDINDRYLSVGGMKHKDLGEICLYLPKNFSEKDLNILDKYAEMILDLYKKSPDHNKILIDPKYNKIGIGNNLNIYEMNVKGFVRYDVYSTIVLSN